MRLDIGYKIIPLMERLEECGDLIFVKETDDFCRIGAIDALGHGSAAHIAAEAALIFLNENCSLDPAEDIVKIHSVLQKTRGAVMGLCYIDKITGELTYSGIGNITARVLGSDQKKLVFRDGVVGYSMPTVRNQKMTLSPGDILLLYSDGMKEHFNMIDVPNLFKETAESISAALLNKYSKKNDDASIITLKVLYD